MRIWITVSTFNRKKITEISIKQLVKHKQDSFVHVTDDISTDYDLDWIRSLGVDQVENPPEKYGIDKIRAWELKKFLDTDYDLLYFTDNDAFHDPNYVNILKHAYDKFKKPVSLYNSIYHRECEEFLDNDFISRKTIPGISQLYDRDAAKKIDDLIDIKFPNGIGMWDYMFIDMIEIKPVTSITSYVQHYGANGLHSGPLDYEKDRASSPTQYLTDTREEILKKLL